VSVVAIVDDDESVRRALGRRLRAAGHQVETFASARSFLDRADGASIRCIVTDLSMPGMSGLELQAALTSSGDDIPMVFITGHGDVPASVRAMRAGAVHFLPKPFSDAEILAAIAEALAIADRRGEQRGVADAVASRYATLTSREREVFALVVEGLMNKVIADRLGAAEKTIKIHRGRVMAKMNAKSLPDLVRMAAYVASRYSPEPQGSGRPPAA
jgi:FixJ family two-component response regulator